MPWYHRHRAASLIMLCCTGACAQPVPTPDEIDAVARHFRVDRYGDEPLDSAPMRPDGSRSLVIAFASEAPDDDALIAFTTYCHADAVVVARFVSSVSVLTRNRSMILTRSLFSKERIIKDASVDAPVPTLFDVTSPGGAVTDEHGQVLSVVFRPSTPFAKEQSYLLFLQREPGLSGGHYLPAGAPVQVVDQNIYPVRGSIWREPRGTPLEDLLTLMRRGAPDAPCRR